MELLEVELGDACIETDIKMSCIIPDDEYSAGGICPIGRFKAFQNIMYNQLECDAYACTYVGSITAISNLTGKELPLDELKAGFEKFRTGGKFTPGYGALGIDGADAALDTYNSYFGTHIEKVQVPLNEETMYTALNSGSPICTAIRYGKSYFKNEQDDGQIQNIDGTMGNNGHWISIVVLNNQDPKFKQIKYIENYNGILKYQIIFLHDFIGMRELFANGGVYFIQK